MGPKKLQVWLPLLFAIVMIVGMMIGFQLKEKTLSPQFFSPSGRSSLQELTELIKTRYVDKVSQDSINGLVSNELLKHLDPHSVFIPSAELQAANEDIMGNFQGIGIEFRQINDTVNVMNIMPGGPSEKVGLQAGDQLIYVNDSISIAGKKLDGNAIRKLFRGPANSTVKVKYLRQGKMLETTITRGNIPVSSVDAAYMIAPKVGFIRLNKFAERTYEEFMTELEKLQAQKMENLILDLRGNTGGLMKEAVDMADEFLSDNKLIVYTEGDNSPRTNFTAKRPGLFETGKLIVLIDETSASASEILAGALQDWDRAVIMGRRSFGKGLVQQQFQLSDGAAVRLTVARYFTPLGRNIQKSYAEGYDKYNEELMGRFHATDSSTKKDSAARSVKKYKTPAGKTVFGGGGITPDSTVLFDSSLYTRSVLQVLMTSTLNDFAYYDFVTNRAQYTRYKTATDFNQQYKVSPEQWKGFVQYASKEGLNFNAIDARSKAFIENRIKALIARQLWRTNGYFVVANSADILVEKALSAIQK